MPKLAIAAALAVLAAAGTARADTLPLITPPAGYTAGVPISFTLTAPGIVNLTSFNIDLIVTTADPSSPPDLTLTATRPDSAAYALGDAGQFQSSVSPGSSVNQLNLNVNGSVWPGVTTVAGANDVLAIITITPGSGLTGPINVMVAPSTLLFSINQENFLEVSPPPPFDIAQSPSPVPTPAAWVSLGIGGLGMAVARRRLDRKAC